MTAPPAARRPRQLFFTLVGRGRNAPAAGDRRPALAALRLRALAGVTRAALLYDPRDPAARAAAEALASDLPRARPGLRATLHPLSPDDPHARAAVAPAVGRVVDAVVREPAEHPGERELVTSLATGSLAGCAALLEALEALGEPLAAVYDGPDDGLSVWRSVTAPAVEPALRRLGGAPAAANVLLQGPPGADLGGVARRLHEAWGRAFLRKGELVTLHPGAFPPELLAAQLFGPAKGAFRRADGGTLVLDEVAELPLGLQTHLLSALDLDAARMRLVKPLTDEPARPADVRLIAATRRDLPAMARAGAFRPELLARLATHLVALPALATARHQIVITYLHALEDAARHYPVTARGPTRFTLESEARQRLLALAFAPAARWPWNHQEVIQSAERLCLRAWAERPPGPPPTAVKVSLADVAAEAAELTARWAAAADLAPDADGWAAVEERVLPAAWPRLSQVERWELRFLLEARDATTTNADAWRYIAARNLLEGASDPRSLRNASNAFDKRWRRYAAKLRPPR
jgi:transcriptional regulator with AAA-type ATPase domain